MKKPVLIALLICILLPSWASAEILGGTFEINPFVGYCTTANSPEFCHKKIIGLRLGYNLTDRWELEAAYSKVESSAELLGVDLLYHLTPEKRFTPFILAGIGNAHVSPRNKDSYNTLMGDIGAGFKYSLSNCMSFRSEIRNVVTHSNNVIVSAGLTFTLGKKTPKAVPAPEPAPAPKPQPLPEPKPAPKPEPAAVAKPQPQPEPKPEPAPVPKAEPIKIVLEDVHFENNRYSLTSAAKEILQRDIVKLKENPGLEIEIQGHTSAIGSDEYNMKLSAKRANTVKAYLIQEGISADRLTAKAYGERMPEVPEPKPKKESAAAKMNRRVHFEIKVK
ncbi:MAG: OmpA family protein [Nitrospirae bacterium]|nr:OmpA family protein [Nitrospirota bacterium]